MVLRPAAYLCLWLSIASIDSHAQGEHVRRAGAELRVLQDDVQRWQQAGGPQRQGLLDRLLGGLATLDIVLRQADADADADDRPIPSRVVRIRESGAALRAGDVVPLEVALIEWINEYPLHLPAGDVAIRREAAAQLHRSLCAGCHDSPVTGVERPAYNLFEEARRLDDETFFARLVVGVRGDRVTGLGNPLSDAQVMGLMAYYRSPTDDPPTPPAVSTGIR